LWAFVDLPTAGALPVSGGPKSVAFGRDVTPVIGETLLLHGDDSHE